MKIRNKFFERGKKYIYYIGSIIFGCACSLMCLVKYGGSVWGTKEENYLLPMNWWMLIIFLLAALFAFGFLQLCDYFLARTVQPNKKYIENRKKFILIISIIIIIAWLPYFLSYYPGGVYSDTFSAINMAMGKSTINNSQPVLYTLLFKLVITLAESIGKDLTWGIGILFALQMLMVGIAVVYFLSWMLRHKIGRTIIIISTLYLIFFPLMPLYAVSLWKDTPFAAAVLFYTLNLTDLYLNRKKEQVNFITVFSCVFWGIIAILMRNNGSYMIAGTAVLYMIAMAKQYKNKKYQGIVYAGLALSMVLAMIIQGPIYRSIGVTEKQVTAYLGIPLQQIGRVVAYDGNITEEQREQIDQLMPYEEIKEKYVPCLTDSLKWDESFNQEYLREHKAEFFKLWWELLLQNPKEYIKAYILITEGFWCLNVAGYDGYVQNFVWDNTKGVVQTDLFEKWFGVSFQNLVNPKAAISSAWYFWLLFFSMVICIKKCGFRQVVIYLPLFLVWATLMVATPIAVSMRYVQPLVLAAPLFAVFPVILLNEKAESKIELAR